MFLYLLHASWKAESMTVSLPNVWLKQRGASREVKRRVLRNLEAAGLITVERTGQKEPAGDAGGPLTCLPATHGCLSTSATDDL